MCVCRIELLENVLQDLIEAPLIADAPLTRDGSTGRMLTAMMYEDDGDDDAKDGGGDDDDDKGERKSDDVNLG